MEGMASQGHTPRGTGPREGKARAGESERMGALHRAPGDLPSYDLTGKRSRQGGLPGLEIIAERFAVSFRRTLSSALRQSCDLRPISTEVILFSDFVLQVPRPTGLFVFQMNPLPGGCAVVIDGHLLLALVDALCGGGNIDLENSPQMTERDLTTVEHRLLRRLAQPMCDDLRHAWEPIAALRPEFGQIVVRPELSHLADDPESVLFSVFEIQVGNFSSPLGIILPMPTVEPIKDRLLRVSHVPGHVRGKGGTGLAEHIPDIEVELSVELGRTSIDVRKLLSLKEGDVLRLDTGSEAPLRATIEGETKFLGTPDVSGSILVFTIEERVP